VDIAGEAFVRELVSVHHAKTISEKLELSKVSNVSDVTILHSSIVVKYF